MHGRFILNHWEVILLGKPLQEKTHLGTEWIVVNLSHNSLTHVLAIHDLPGESWRICLHRCYLCLAGTSSLQDGLTKMLSLTLREAALLLLVLVKDQGCWKFKRQGKLILAQLLKATVIGQVFHWGSGGTRHPLYIQTWAWEPLTRLVRPKAIKVTCVKLNPASSTWSPLTVTHVLQSLSGRSPLQPREGWGVGCGMDTMGNMGSKEGVTCHPGFWLCDSGLGNTEDAQASLSYPTFSSFQRRK